MFPAFRVFPGVPPGGLGGEPGGGLVHNVPQVGLARPHRLQHVRLPEGREDKVDLFELVHCIEDDGWYSKRWILFEVANFV